MGNMSDADRQKFRDAMQKAMAGKDASKITPEERQKMTQDVMAKLGIAGGGRQGGAPGGGGRGGPGGPGGMANPLEMMMRTSSSPFTEAERNNARLPLPPGQDSQVQVLLRPGLLADVEIQVEKLSNVIHIPAQAIFQKDGKYTVFVRKNGKFEPREVQLVKQSESAMVLSGGVQPGEIVALADPTVDKSDKKGKADKNSQGGGNAMGSLPGGK
jgi:multidrug efflux pump subunit AcrA (membrane-fusion protein)